MPTKEKTIPKLKIEGAELLFKNFNGQPTQYNPEGKRNFCVLIDLKDAAKLKEDGWNIRFLEGRAEGDEPRPYMQVSVSYDIQPPNIMLVTKRNKTQLKVDDVGMLDFAEIIKVDLVINPYVWHVNGKTGVKAYLHSMYVTIEEDEFAEKYEHIGFENSEEK